MNKDILPVLDEITAILKKNDMNGFIVVGNKSHCDHRIVLGASWGCTSLEAQPDGSHLIRIRSKLVEYPSKAHQHLALTATVGFFVTLHDVLRHGQNQAEQIMLLLHKNGVEFEGRTIREDG